MTRKQLRTCEKGHRYYKSSDCPVCPVCGAERKPGRIFLSQLSAPARRAMESKGISKPEQLARYSEKEILALHGIGKTSMPRLNEALRAAGLTFKKE
ncbi:MAG: hypothetical protein HZA79_02365 [Sphingobacteriales bacterium]|nr:hypothetical protein [Sphingobacteriales bacterium]